MALVLILGTSVALGGALDGMRERDAAAKQMTLRVTASTVSIPFDPTQSRAVRHVHYVRDGDREALSWTATHPDPTYRPPGDRHYSGDYGPSGELVVWQAVRFDGVRTPESSVAVQVYQRVDVFPDGSLVRHPEHVIRTVFAPGTMDAVWFGRECLLALGIGVTEQLAEPATVENTVRETYIRGPDSASPALQWVIVVDVGRPTIPMCVFLRDPDRLGEKANGALVCHTVPLIGISTIGEVVVGEHRLATSGWVDREGMSRVMVELRDARFEADHDHFQAIAARVADAVAHEEISERDRRFVD